MITKWRYILRPLYWFLTYVISLLAARKRLYFESILVTAM